MCEKAGYLIPFDYRIRQYICEVACKVYEKASLQNTKIIYHVNVLVVTSNKTIQYIQIRL